MAGRPLAIKLRVEDSEVVTAALRAFGESGQAALAKVEKAANPTAVAFERLRGRYDEAFASQQRFTRDLGQAERALKAGVVSAEEYARVVELIRQRQTALATSAVTATGATRGFGGIVQQAGFQIGDFAVQVASGQGALRAFIQQGSQLLGFFGAYGAAAGAALAIGGALATSFLGLADSTGKATNAEDAHTKALERAKKITEELTQASDNRARSLEAERRLILQKAAAETRAAQAEVDSARMAAAVEAAMTGGPGAEPVADGPEERAARQRAAKALAIELALRGESGQFDDATSGQFRASRADLQGADKDVLKADEAARKAAESLTSLINRYDEGAKKAHDFWAVQGELNKALDEGRITQERHAEVLGRAIETIWSEKPVMAQTAAVRENTVAQRERASSLDEYIARLRDQLVIEQQDIDQRGEVRALIEAQDRAQRDYAAGLRDTPLLREEEAAAVRALAGDVEKLKGIETDRAKAAKEAGRAYEDQRRAVEKSERDFERRFEHAVEEATDAGAQVFYDLFVGRIESIGEFLRQVLLRNISQALAEAFIRPIAQNVVGSFIGFPAGGVPGGGAVGGIGTPPFNPGIFGSLFAGGNIFTGGYTGSALAGVAPAGIFGTSTGLLGLLGGAGLGWGIGSMIPSLNGRVGPGNQIGGALGGLAGAAIGSIIPGVGTLLGGLIGGAGGGLLGGLFGAKPSVGPNSTAAVELLPWGLTATTVRTDNGGDWRSASDFAIRASQALNQLREATGGSFVGSPLLTFGSFGGQFFSGFGGGLERAVYRGGDADAAIVAAARALVGAGHLTAPGSAGIALRNSSAATLEGLLADVQFARGLDRLQLDDVERAVAEINDRYGEQIQRAQALGLETGKLVELRDREIRAAREQANLSARQAVVAAGGSIVDFLNRESLSATAAASPLDAIAEAQRQFGSALERVRGGELGGVQGLLSSADALLQLGRSTYATGPEFGALRSMVVSQLESVGRTITGQDYIRDQIEATRQQAEYIGNKLDEQTRLLERIVSELNRTRLQQQVMA
jgi:hypothetical protein